MNDEDALQALDLTLAEAKALYALISDSKAAEAGVYASIMGKLEKRLYDVLSLEEMDALSMKGREGDKDD